MHAKIINYNITVQNLGFDKSSSGNQRKKIKTLINHALRGARIFSSSNLYQFQFGLCLKSHLHQKLASPLAYSHLSSDRYHFLQKKYISLAISSMDYNNTWLIKLRFGYHPYFQLQLKHLETESLIKNIYIAYDNFSSNQTRLNLFWLC